MYENMKKKFDDIKWKPFQQTMLNECKNEADRRAIFLIEDVDKIINGLVKNLEILEKVLFVLC